MGLPDGLSIIEASVTVAALLEHVPAGLDLDVTIAREMAHRIEWLVSLGLPPGAAVDAAGTSLLVDLRAAGKAT
jgi:hypothetical protein